MKKIVKILLFVFVTTASCIMFTGCFTFLERVTRDDFQTGIEPIVVVSNELNNACIDLDAKFFEAALDEKEFLLFENYSQFCGFFEGYDYDEYSHMLDIFDDFTFGKHNLVVLRAEKTYGKTINFAGWFSFPSFRMPSAIKDNKQHYFLVQVAKEVETIIVLPPA